MTMTSRLLQFPGWRLSRGVYTGTGPRPPDQKAAAIELAAHRKKVSKTARRTRDVVLGAIVAGIGAFAWKAHSRRKRLRDLCGEPLPQDRFIKVDLPLVRYAGFVLPESFVMSGLMDRVAEFETRPDDLIVAGFPRSGSMWLQEIVYLLKNPSERKRKEPKGGEEPSILEGSKDKMEDIFPYLEFSYPGLKELGQREGGRLMKTHLPRNLLPKSVEGGKQTKVLYVYRNPKDVAVSYFHFASVLSYVQYSGTFERFARLFIRDKVPYTPYFAHTGGYAALAAESPQQCMAVAYEDLKADPKKVIRAVAAFIGADAGSDEEVAALAAETTLEAMRANPRTNCDHWGMWGIVLKRDRAKNFMLRKGEVGDYETHLTDKYASEEFDKWMEEELSTTTKGGFKFKFSDK